MVAAGPTGTMAANTYGTPFSIASFTASASTVYGTLLLLVLF